MSITDDKMGHINHCLTYAQMKEMWRKEDEAIEREWMIRKIAFLLKEKEKQEARSKKASR